MADLGDAGSQSLYEHDQSMSTFGIELMSATDAGAELRMPVRSEICNGYGILHGGMTFLLADTAMALAANAGQATVLAASASIDWLQPVEVGDIITAVAARRWTNGRTAMWDVTVSNAAGETVAIFRGTTKLVSRPPAEG
jgi:acyl-CoA thioesterase